MPNITKQFHIDITPEQYLSACSKEELLELDLLLDKYLKIYRILDKEKLQENSEEKPLPTRICYKTRGICNHNCPGQCRESC